MTAGLVGSSEIYTGSCQAFLLRGSAVENYGVLVSSKFSSR